MMSQRFTFLTMAWSLVALLGLGSVLFADSWALPEPEKYYSADKKYYFEVIPRKLESQLKYFEDKVSGRKDPGSPERMEGGYCKGVLYRLGEDKKYHQKWAIRLSNEVAPVKALLSATEPFVVTFDNWHRVGHGDDIVVIYGPEGKLIKRFALEDIISKDEMGKIPRSVSSRWWGGKHYLDEGDGTLVLKIVSNGKMPWHEGAKFQEVRIDLKRGELIKR